MKPKEAAILIGCSVQQVRTLIRNGNLKAKKIKTDQNRYGYLYDIPKSEVTRYSKTVHGNRGRTKV